MIKRTMHKGVNEKSNFSQKMKTIYHKIVDVEDDPMPKGMKKGKGLFVFCMIIVALLHFAVFYIGVNYKSIVLAFKKTDIFGNTTFTLDWFKDFLNEFTYKDSIILNCFLNTFKYFILNSFFLFATGFFISYFLYKKVFGYKFFKVVFYLFGIISGTVIVTLYQELVAVEGPLYKMVYDLTGYKMPFLLQEESTATKTIMAYCMWTGLASNFILLTGAMNRIPEELIEAAKLDGCGWVREMFLIVTPLIWDTLGTLFIMSFIGIFQASGPIMLFNTGESTYTFSYWIYLQVTAGSYNYPAAVGLLMTLITFPLVLLARKLLGKIETVEY